MKRRAAVAPADEPVLAGLDGLGNPARWIVGVSGGADSTALLLLLNRFRRRRRLSLFVVHVHHGLRGWEADRDAAFVARLCHRLRLPCTIVKTDVAAVAAASRWSLEQAAREERLRIFAEAVRARKARGVILAHTMNDQAETLLIRLLRGSGASGLAGMRGDGVVRGLRILRPLLGITRMTLEKFLRHARQSWHEDSSNRDVAILRNAVRRRILPELESVTGRGLAGALARTAGILAEEERVWDSLVAKADRRCRADAGGLNMVKLAREPVAIQRRVLLAWLWSHGVAADFDVVERVRGLDVLRNRALQLAGGVRIARHARGTIRLQKPSPAPALPGICLAPGRTVDVGRGLVYRLIKATGASRTVGGAIGRYPVRVRLDSARVKGREICVRAWRSGDRIHPAGGVGRRKLQDIFTDAKVPREERPKIPVVVVDDVPVWIPGFRIAEGWQVQGRRTPAFEILVRRSTRR